jgi:hypothetical protein
MGPKALQVKALAWGVLIAAVDAVQLVFLWPALRQAGLPATAEGPASPTPRVRQGPQADGADPVFGSSVVAAQPAGGQHGLAAALA